MKSLCLLLAWLGQFQVVELDNKTPAPVLFLQEELVAKPVPEKKADSLPVFDFLTADWCGACRGVKQALGVDPRGVSTKGGLFSVRTHNVDSSGWLGATSIPAFAYKGRVFQYGYSTPENLLENYRQVILKETVKSKSAPLRLTTAQLKEFARTYNGEPYGVSDGNYWRHLQNGTTHKFTAQQLNGLTQAECAKIHAGDHYGYLTPFSIGGK